MKHTRILSLLTVYAITGLAAFAGEQAQSPEARLRERLRDTMLQLRASETERANLQAAQQQSAEEKKDLTARLEAITKEANASKLVAAEVPGLKAQAARQEKEIEQLKESLETSRHDAEQARLKEAERAKVVDEIVTELQRLVADRQAKNLALFKTASEILDRYQKFGLGDALAAREPFVGITRVKLQNLVQDYQDKLSADRTTLNEKDLSAYRDKLLNPARLDSATTAQHATE